MLLFSLHLLLLGTKTWAVATQQREVIPGMGGLSGSSGQHILGTLNKGTVGSYEPAQEDGPKGASRWIRGADVAENSLQASKLTL